MPTLPSSPPQTSLPPALPVRFHEFYDDWTQAQGLTHSDEGTLRRFIKGFPQLFGLLDDVVVQGYRSWLARSGEPDSSEAFAHYCDPRYRRWRVRRSAPANGHQRSGAAARRTVA